MPTEARGQLALLGSDPVGVPRAARQVFSYIRTPLHRSPRLDPDYAGPAVMWSQNLRDRNVDYRGLELPGCDAKTARSIEMTWNFTIPDDGAMQRLADAFIKVEEQLPELRRHELAAR